MFPSGDPTSGGVMETTKENVSTTNININTSTSDGSGNFEFTYNITMVIVISILDNGAVDENVTFVTSAVFDEIVVEINEYYNSVFDNSEDYDLSILTSGVVSGDMVELSIQILLESDVFYDVGIAYNETIIVTNIVDDYSDKVYGEQNNESFVFFILSSSYTFCLFIHLFLFQALSLTFYVFFSI